MAGVEDGEEGDREICGAAEWLEVAVAVADEDVVGADTRIVNVGVGAEAVTEASGFASSVLTMLKPPVIRPPVIARTPPMTAAWTVTFCALYHRASPIFPLRACLA